MSVASTRHVGRDGGREHVLAFVDPGDGAGQVGQRAHEAAPTWPAPNSIRWARGASTWSPAASAARPHRACTRGARRRAFEPGIGARAGQQRRPLPSNSASAGAPSSADRRQLSCLRRCASAARLRRHRRVRRPGARRRRSTGPGSGPSGKRSKWRAAAARPAWRAPISMARSSRWPPPTVPPGASAVDQHAGAGLARHRAFAGGHRHQDRAARTPRSCQPVVDHGRGMRAPRARQSTASRIASAVAGAFSGGLTRWPPTRRWRRGSRRTRRTAAAAAARPRPWSGGCCR